MIIYVSPHLDDAVLSSGGLINRKKDEPIQVINFFSKCISPDLNIETNEEHTLRRKNEEALLMQSGNWPNLSFMYLDFPDAPLRGYDLTNGIPQFLHPGGEDVLFKSMEQKFQQVANTQNALLYFPLSIGGHVDHQLCTKLSESFIQGGFYPRVRFYEDLPYATKFDVFPFPADFIRYYNLVPELIEIDADRKTMMYSFYQSQPQKWGQRLREYSKMTDDKERSFERIWCFK